MQKYMELSRILLSVEFFTGMVSVFYFFRLKNSYWKWFCIYLIFIFIQELFWFPKLSFWGIKKPEYVFFLGMTKQEYYAFWGVPIQYLFFFWLFALKSLKNKKLFISCSLLFIAVYIPVELYYKHTDAMYVFNISLGTLLLSILVVLEFLKQIRSDDILNFTKNKMFYIVIGVILFYIGNYPLFSFRYILAYDYVTIWNIYYLYFLVSNCIMYLLFIASFLWGKQVLK